MLPERPSSEVPLDVRSPAQFQQQYYTIISLMKTNPATALTRSTEIREWLDQSIPLETNVDGTDVGGHPHKEQNAFHDSHDSIQDGMFQELMRVKDLHRLRQFFVDYVSIGRSIAAISIPTATDAQLLDSIRMLLGFVDMNSMASATLVPFFFLHYRSFETFLIFLESNWHQFTFHQNGIYLVLVSMLVSIDACQAVLSSRKATLKVALLSNFLHQFIGAIQLEPISYLTASGVSAVLRKFQAWGPNLKRNPEAFLSFVIMANILLYHADGDIGSSDFFKFDCLERSHPVNILQTTSTLECIIRILQFRVFCLLSVFEECSHALNDANLCLAISLLSFANKLKTKAYDNTSVGVLSAAPLYRSKSAGRGLMYQLLCVCVLLHCKIEAIEQSLERERSVEASSIRTKLIVARNLTFHMLQGFVSVVAYSNNNPRLENLGLRNIGYHLTPSNTNVIPRFSESIASVFEIVLNDIESRPDTLQFHFKLLQRLLPPFETNGEMVSQIWSIELLKLKEQIIQVLRISGYTCIAAGHRALLCFISALEPLQDIFKILMSELLQELLLCMRPGHLYGGRMDVVARWMHLVTSLPPRAWESIADASLYSAYENLRNVSIQPPLLELNLELLIFIGRHAFKGREPSLQKLNMQKPSKFLLSTVAFLLESFSMSASWWSTRFDFILGRFLYLFLPSFQLTTDMATQLTSWIISVADKAYGILQTSSLSQWLDDDIRFFRCITLLAERKQEIPEVGSKLVKIISELRRFLTLANRQLPEEEGIESLLAMLQESKPRAPKRWLEQFEKELSSWIPPRCQSFDILFVNPFSPLPASSTTLPCMPNKDFLESCRSCLVQHSEAASTPLSILLGNEMQSRRSIRAVVFKEYSQNSFREMSMGVGTDALRRSVATENSTQNSLRTVSNTSRAPSVHVDVFQDLSKEVKDGK